MTSHFIDRFAKRAAHLEPSNSSSRSPHQSAAPRPAGGLDKRAEVERAELSGVREERCTFCNIVAGEEPAFTAYEDEHVMAFLDILPIRPGHLLLIPKRHHQRVTDLPDDLGAHLGRVMPRLTRALCRATGQPDFNVVSNQGYAQVVPHLHFHFVPAPLPSASGSTQPKARHMRIGRDELTDEEGEEMARKIWTEVEREFEGFERRSTSPGGKL
ncbi:hypothetical protein JCM10296v2_004755 [Rhodotorula toruloides]